MFDSANKPHFTLDITDLDYNPQLQVLAFDGIDCLNSDYYFEITLVSNHIRYDITKLLTKSAYLSFNSNKIGVHGSIHQVKRGAVGKDYALFKVLLAPKFTHLHKRFNQRKFVDKSVIEIISIILKEHGQQESIDFEFKLKEQYPKREFCCQYQETDADFTLLPSELSSSDNYNQEDYIYTEEDKRFIYNVWIPYDGIKATSYLNLEIVYPFDLTKDTIIGGSQASKKSYLFLYL